jgi:hypothetical protein
MIEMSRMEGICVHGEGERGCAAIISKTTCAI